MNRRASSERDASRACGWCRGALSATARADAVYCSKRCRQAAHRFYRGCVERDRAATPLRLAYADPPYPGLARRYYGCEEVDHAELLSSLQEYDGWALSTSAAALRDVLALCPPSVRVAAWFRGERPTKSRWPLNAWEPVVFAGGRAVASGSSETRRVDALIHPARPRTTDPRRVIGSKPADFVWWLFDLLGARPGDEFYDLFPGSGRVAQAWHRYVSRASTGDRRSVPVDERDASDRDLDDASRGPEEDASRVDAVAA